MKLGVPEKTCAYPRLSLIVKREIINSIPNTQMNLIINVKGNFDKILSVHLLIIVKLILNFGTVNWFII